MVQKGNKELVDSLHDLVDKFPDKFILFKGYPITVARLKSFQYYHVLENRLKDINKMRTRVKGGNSLAAEEYKNIFEKGYVAIDYDLNFESFYKRAPVDFKCKYPRSSFRYSRDTLMRSYGG